MIYEVIGQRIDILSYGRIFGCFRVLKLLLIHGAFLMIRLKNYLFYFQSRNVIIEKLNPSVRKFSAEYLWGFYNSGLSEMFWRNYSTEAKYNFMYIITRPDAKIDQKILDRLDSMGVYWVFMFRHKTCGRSRYYRKYLNFYDVTAIFKSIMFHLKFCRFKSIDLVLLQLKIYFLINTYSWRNAFQDTQSLMLMLVNESVPDNLPALAGASLADCISLGKQKSIHHLCPETSHMCHDAYFIWSPINDNIYKDSPYSKIKTRVYTGPLYDYFSGKPEKLVTRLQSSMDEKSYNVGFFDHMFKESFDDGGFWGNCWIDRKTFVDIYLGLFELFSKYPMTTLILKSKHNLMDIHEISPKLCELISQNRCILLSEVSPCVAASYCNLIISGWDLPTAGFEALPFTRDHRSVLLDLIGYRHAMFKNLDLSDFIFPDIDSLLYGLDKHLLNTAQSQFGNWGPLLDKVLIYKDTEGFRRAASYIDWIFQAKGSAQEKLNEANRKYLSVYHYIEAHHESRNSAIKMRHEIEEN